MSLHSSDDRNDFRQSAKILLLAILTLPVHAQLPPPPVPPVKPSPAPQLPDRTKPSEISGQVTRPDGRPVSAGMRVTAVRRWAAANMFATPVYTGSTTDAQGRFRIQNLASGYYLVCADPDGLPLLDPCHWSLQPPVRLLQGGEQAVVNVPLMEGAFLHVRVDGVQRSGTAADRAALRNVILAGVHTPTGVFLHASLAAIDGRGVNFRIAIPRDKQIPFGIQSAQFDFDDERGQRVEGNRPLFVQAARTEAEINLRLVGRARGRQ